MCVCALLASRGDSQEDIALKTMFDYAMEYKEMKEILMVLGVIEPAQTKEGITSDSPSGLAKDCNQE